MHTVFLLSITKFKETIADTGYKNRKYYPDLAQMGGRAKTPKKIVIEQRGIRTLASYDMRKQTALQSKLWGLSRTP